MNNVVEFARPTRKRRPSAASTALGIPRGAALPDCLDSWLIALESANKSPKTIRSYMDVGKMFIAYLTRNGLPSDAQRVATEHVRSFLAAERARTSPASADVCFRNLRVWFNWLIAEGERTTPLPVLRADRPQVAKKAKKYLSLEEQAALLHSAGSNTFEDRRDTAIMRILGDSGPRATGLMDVRFTPSVPETHDVDLKGRRIRIRLKGGDQHWVPLGARAIQALDRYIRVRSAHPAVSSSWLWLGIQGRGIQHMTSSGLRAMLRRRGAAAGIVGVIPHRYRGSAAHELLKAGASKDAVQSILGWRTSEMVEHYTSDLAEERAREIHARFSPGDRI